jgi:hypothetical protein
MNYKLILIVVSSFVIPIMAIVTAITNQEIRCFLRLDSGQICLSGFTKVQLVVRNKKYEPIQGVEVRFLAQGAPDVKYTDSNGFSDIQIPSREDIEITLIKDGFETLNQVVNVGNSPDDRTRTFQLKGNSLEGQASSVPVTPSVSPKIFSPALTPSPHPAGLQETEDNDYKVQLKGCRRSNTRVRCDLLITNLASKDRSFRLSIDDIKIIADAGDAFKPREVQVGIANGTVAKDTLASNIQVKGSILFEEVPIQINNFSMLELKYNGAPYREPTDKIQIFKINVQQKNV